MEFAQIFFFSVFIAAHFKDVRLKPIFIMFLASKMVATPNVKPKKKRHSYPIKTKLQICEEKSNGASVEALMGKYRVPYTTILGILEDADKWKDAVGEQGLSVRLKRIRPVKSDDVERSVLEFMEKSHQQQRPITGDLISVGFGRFLRTGV